MNARTTLFLFVLLGSGLAAGVVQAEENAWRTSGMMAAEVRGFADSPAYAGHVSR
jgi:hypothetical protein